MNTMSEQKSKKKQLKWICLNGNYCLTKVIVGKRGLV